MSFETALTGLKAATADLDVTGNNIANSATVGFKGSRAEFADIFATTSLGVSANAIGQGVRLANVRQEFSQGQLDFTGNSLDLAINGPGFFRLSDAGNTVYSRAGAFQLDRDGYIVNSANQRLTGFQADNQGNITGATGELQVATGDIAPRATGTNSEPVAITANLDAGAELKTQWIDVDGTDLGIPAQMQADDYNFSTSTTVYDSLGREHLMTWYFRSSEYTANDNGTPADPTDDTMAQQWEVYVGLDGESNPQNMRRTTAEFDSTGGLSRINGTDVATRADGSVMTTMAPFTVAPADPLDIDLDLAGLTQYGTPFAVSQISQNGYAAGQFSGLNVESDGTLFARYTNGQSEVLGQVTLSRFPSPENLQEVGGTNWVETFSSGTPVSGRPGESGLGNLQSGALEQSNVDITEQLVKMISAQRNYSANSQMISTQDQITREILNIRG